MGGSKKVKKIPSMCKTSLKKLSESIHNVITQLSLEKSLKVAQATKTALHCPKSSGKSPAKKAKKVAKSPKKAKSPAKKAKSPKKAKKAKSPAKKVKSPKKAKKVAKKSPAKKVKSPKKSSVKKNPWMTHLASFRKSHPKLSGKEVMSQAKKTYKK
jgi:hypothetical protein